MRARWGLLALVWVAGCPPSRPAPPPDPLELHLATLRGGDAAARRLAVAAIASRADGGRAVVPLTAALRDPEPELRRAAAAALGVVGGGDATAYLALRDALSGDPSPEVRRAAVQATAAAFTTGGPGADAVVALGRCAREDPAPEVRLAALEALVARPHDRAAVADALVALLAEPRLAEGDRVRLIRALGAVGPAAVPALERVYDAGPETPLGLRAAVELTSLHAAPLHETYDQRTRALAAIRWARRTGPTLQPTLITLLGHYTRLEDPEVLDAAYGALHELGAPARPELEAALRGAVAGPGDAARALAAVRLLRRLGSDGVGLLEEATRHDAYDVVRAAFDALTVLGPPARPALERALRRREASYGLSSGAIARELRDAFAREAAARALGELGDPGGLEPLLQALHDPEASVRGQALEAIACLGSAAWPHLDELSRHLDRRGGASALQCQAEAARAVARLGGDGPRVREEVAAWLRDAPRSAATAWALGRLRAVGQEHVGWLRACCASADRAVRAAALVSLGRLDLEGRRTVERVEPAVPEAVWRTLRDRVAQALLPGELGGHEARWVAEELAADAPEPALRQAATAVLPHLVPFEVESGR